VEDELAEILVEGQEDSLLVRAESGDLLIRDAGTLFSDREHVPTCLPQRLQSRPRKVLVGHGSHAVLRG
jgi:hypothetical protein